MSVFVRNPGRSAKNLPFPNPVPFFRHTLISLDEFTFLLIQSRTMEPKRAMEAVMGRFCDIFDLLLGNHMPWCDRTVIADCEKQVKEAASGVSDEAKSEKIMRLSWALVHSKQQQDVQRGIEMLEASLTNCSSPLENREKLYLLGVGYYRTGKFPRSGQLADQCLEASCCLEPALSGVAHMLWTFVFFLSFYWCGFP
ncbi:mitochondrial fission 1 protein A-like isoform X2 [Actinidia eriantha]|uniref:mitochondrial fission 1 protein A-like isoform X2 n=1 Tax=Actinidia eriantha TaxID=165200 RepID=UPI0025858383|nr:mitochondrial fission 1 protein A-like isoform X2 [Actinidia eriantha]